MTNVAALVICNSRPLPEEMLAAAKDEQIAVFTTDKNQFQVSGEVYSRLGAST
jgi:serine kinase of HPr protein (carbohydrate metabolism regulator)